MKADFALHQNTLGHGPSAADHAQDFAGLVARVAARTRLAVEKLAEFLRPVTPEEEYLSRATDIADLERRITDLQFNRRRKFSNHY